MSKKDWRIHRKFFTAAIAVCEGKDDLLEIREIFLPLSLHSVSESVDWGKLENEIPRVDVEPEDRKSLYIMEDENFTGTHWYRPSYVERLQLERSLEKPVLVETGEAKLAVSPSDMTLGAIGLWLRDWNLTDEQGKKLSKEEVYEIHGVVFATHFQLFRKDMLKM